MWFNLLASNKKKNDKIENDMIFPDYLSHLPGVSADEKSSKEIGVDVKTTCQSIVSLKDFIYFLVVKAPDNRTIEWPFRLVNDVVASQPALAWVTSHKLFFASLTTRQLYWCFCCFGISVEREV